MLKRLVLVALLAPTLLCLLAPLQPFGYLAPSVADSDKLE
jgi:hypothetical protein